MTNSKTGLPKVPRCITCWVCSKKLRAKKGGGYSYAEVELEGFNRIIHISCEDLYWEQCRQELESMRYYD